MSRPFKPEGYNSVSPYLIVKDANRFIEFLKTLFDGQELRRYERPDGSIMHAEVKIYDSVIMTAEASDRYPATSFWMHVYVPDAQAIYDKALALGAEGIEPPVTKEGDPDKRGTFKDFAGNFWAVGTQL